MLIFPSEKVSSYNHLIQVIENNVQHDNAVHREDVWVLLYCDNFSDHLDETVGEIFFNGKKYIYVTFLQT